MRESIWTAGRAIAAWSPARLFVAVFVISAIVFFLRFPDRILEPQFRVEDGNIFFMEEALYGSKTFLYAYGGYLHTLQRAIALLGGWVHPYWAPAFYNGCALIIMAAVAARIAVARIPAGWRLSFTALFLLQPLAGWQAVNVTNLFWFTAALLPVLAIEGAPVSRRGRALTLATAAVLALSGPFSAFLAPLFALRLIFLDRTKYSVALLVAVTAAAAIQVSYFLRGARGDNLVLAEKIPALSDWGMLANRMLVANFFTKFADESSIGQTIVALAVFGAFGAGCIALFRTRPVSRETVSRIVILSLGGVALYGAGIMGSFGPWSETAPYDDGQRYYMLPCLLFAWVVWALTCAPTFRWLRVPAAALLILGALPMFRDTYRHSITWEQDYRRMDERGFGMLRVIPYGTVHSVFLAKGGGRHGFARGRELRRILSQERIVEHAFGMKRLWARSFNAFVFLFPEKVGDKPGVLVYPNTILSLEIPPGAKKFRGAFGYSPMALPPDRIERKAGGDGFQFSVLLVPEEGDSGLVLSEFTEPGPVRHPPSLRSFSFVIPPGDWKAVVLQNTQGPSDDHTFYYDFVLLTDFAFESE